MLVTASRATHHVIPSVAGGTPAVGIEPTRGDPSLTLGMTWWVARDDRDHHLQSPRNPELFVLLCLLEFL
jgi:hypothetical protein